MIVPIAYEAHHRAHLEPVLRLLPHGARRVSPEDVALVASYGDLRRARAQRFTRAILMQHGAGQSYAGDRRRATHPSYPGGEDNDEVGLFLVPNLPAAERWRERYPLTPVEVIGCPILDDLPHKDPAEPLTVAISFHFDVLGSVPEMKSAWEHYRRVLPEIAQRFSVIGHSHPRRSLRREFAAKGIEWVESFQDVCRRADVYVCDNSSTIPEFASTGRPVVLLNDPKYRRDVSHGGRFWDWADIGVQVDDPALLGDTIALALTDPPDIAAARESALDRIYTYRSGATERAAAAITAWLPVAA